MCTTYYFRSDSNQNIKYISNSKPSLLSYYFVHKFTVWAKIHKQKLVYLLHSIALFEKISLEPLEQLVQPKPKNFLGVMFFFMSTNTNTIYLVCILYLAAFLQSNVGGQSHSKAHCRTSQLRFTLFLSSVRVPPESRPSTLGFGDSSISIVNVGGLRCMCNTIWKKKLLFELA